MWLAGMLLVCVTLSYYKYYHGSNRNPTCSGEPESSCEDVDQRESCAVTNMGRERSTAAAEGISLLQRGCEVIKFKGHGGKPHVALLRLSSDEEMLSWQRHGAAKLKMRMDGRDRMLKWASVTDVLIGRESTAFQRARGPRGEVHLSMSRPLLMVAELFSRPNLMFP